MLAGEVSDDGYQTTGRRELANDLGNLVLRAVTLVQSRAGGELGPTRCEVALESRPILDRFYGHVESREHHRAIDVLWTFIRSINAYISDKQPWKVKDDAAVAEILYPCLEALRAAIHLLFPVMPVASQTAARSLGFEIDSLSELRPGTHTYRVTKSAPLFPRR